ncbi:hypothetical protein [Allomuricauda sp. d1]|uniref:hypothetical protein n=1 Tax=Allomuricauda sp. d1 TaxID=3136725 RepID=UPI0031D5AECC
MKNFKITITALALLFTVTTVAQDMTKNETAKEVTKKTYTFYEDGEKITNSVKITKTEKQAVMTEEEDKNRVDQTRVIPPTTVIKTVEIDNDSDEAYDEVIEFSYITEADTDFTLVSDKDNLMVAVEDGENLTIMKNMTIAKDNLNNPKKAYVFTEDDGKKVEFYVKSFNKQNNKNIK